MKDLPRESAYGSAVGLAVLLSLLQPAPVSAQETIGELAAECGGGTPAMVEWCREVALAGQAARAGFGLLASGGSEVPGSAGTLGWRLGSVPRIAVGAEIGGARVPAAALGVEPRSILPDDPFFASSIQLSGAVGLFDGFSLLPTVGGLLSVDLVGTGSFVFLPDDRGFDGASSAYGVGARVGLLRESFTLPGISISAVQRWSGEITVEGVGDATGTVDAAAFFEPSTTSIRATVGKDLLAVGVTAGLGWDRHGGRLGIVSRSGTAEGETGPVVREARAEDLVDSRFLAFGSASLNFLVLQISAEAGWAGGLDPVPGRSPGTGFDPTAGSWFGSLGARLTY